MKNVFLNRFDKIEVPAEYQDLVEAIKPLLSNDSDLNHTYDYSGLRIGFCRIGDSATMLICSEHDDFEYPMLSVGF